MDNVEKERISIEGTLLMLDDSTPHAAVVVQTISDGKVMATALSDESGRYRFVNLKPGEYKIRCYTLNGYVYYGEGKARGGRSRGEREQGGKGAGEIEGEEVGERGDGDILRVESGKTLKGINFRFAPFKKGTWRTYNYLDGLAGNYVSAVYCDPDGVIWFGIGGGVSRYDGKEFVTFTIEDGLAGNNVRAIYCDPDGAVWFGTDGGVSHYDGTEFVNFTTKDGLAGNGVNAIHRAPDGVMWFATGGWGDIGAGISRYDGSEFVNFTTKDGLAGNNVKAIYRDLDGAMWFGTDGGVSRYDGKEFVNLTAEDGLTHNCVSGICRDSDGVMWFATGSPWSGAGVFRYDGKEFVNFTTEHGLVNDIVLAIHCDPDGVLWFGTYGGGVSCYDGKGFVNLTTGDGLAYNEVFAIHRDPDGAMWFGTWGSGVSRYDPNGFISFTTRDGLPDSRIRAMHRDPDGVMWFGAGWWEHGSGLSRYDGVEFVNFTTKDGLADDRVCVISRDPDGMMWFGTVSGVSRYDGKEFVNLDRLAGNWVGAIHRDPDGVMWFGTGWSSQRGNGVFRYDGEELVNLTTADGLAHNVVADIYRDPDGVLWFATGSGGISRYDGKEFVNLTTEDGLLSNRVRNVYRDADGVLWFALLGGVSRYDGVQFTNFTKEDGLASNDLAVCCDAAICQDTDGVIWFATDGGGVSGYDGMAWTSLDTRDGLADNRVGPILQDPDGFLWFATQGGGVTRYRKSTTPPKAHIVSVTTDQTYRLKTQDAGLKTEGLGIPPFTIGTRVTIEYNSIDLKTLPEKRQYRCRVYETGDSRCETSDREVKSRVSRLKSDVPYLPPTKKTSLDWTPEEPGTYVFEVQAIDRDLNYSEPASVKLEVIPDPRNHRIAQLEGELAERERAELERVYRELEDARQIQQSLLPEKPPEIEGFEIAGISIPAREVSGDFYNYPSLGGDAGIVLADVTGKSVKAAMVAAMTNGMLNEAISARKELWDSPSMILRRLNMGLQPHLIRGMYTAMSLSVLRAEEKQLVFSNAGMPYPIVKRGREVLELEVNGMPLGLMDEAEYQDLSFDLEGGDLVVFYSDGVTEAENGAGEMYQTERLLELVQEASSGLSAQEMVDLIVGDVAAYAGGEEASDDITIVVLRCEE